MPEDDATELCERVQSALSDSQIRILRSLHVEQCGSALILSGRVHTFYQKQLAQELVRTVAGKIELINSVDVR